MSIETDRDRQFYDDSADKLPLEALQAHSDTVKKYIAAFEPRLREFASGRSLKVLELGAGSCVTSLLLSRNESVSQIACLDISLKKMQQVLPTSIAALGGACAPEKLSLVEGHFDAPLPFEALSFDMVIFDGALHHARSMWFVLEECRRVLKPQGVLIAQREQYLGVLTAGVKLARLLQTPEVKAGVAENAYLRSQYEYYLRAVGFQSVAFMPVSENALQRVCAFLNGLLFSKWVIWARAPAAAGV
jgi:SAM-dependent methyltransferase